MNISKTSKKLNQTVEKAVYLFFIFVYPFLFVRLGQDYTDGPFHMMSFVGLRSPGYMTALHSAIGTLWMKLTGDYVLSYKILARVLAWVAIVLPSLVVLGFKHDSIKKLRSLAISMILLSNLFMSNFSWDILSLFLIAMIYCAAYVYTKNGNSTWLLLIGIITGALGLARLPSLTIILPLLILIIATRTQQKKPSHRVITDSILLLAATLLSYFLINNMLQSVYPASVVHNGGTTTLGVGQRLNHIIASIVPLCYRYTNEAMRVFEMFGILTLLCVLWVNRKKIEKRHYLVTTLMIALLSLYFILTLLRSPYGRNLWLFLSAIVLGLMAFSIWASSQTKDIFNLRFLVFSFMVGMVSFIGSDTGLFRLFMGYCFVMPFVFYNSQKYLSDDLKKGLTLLLCLAAFFSIINKTLFTTTFDDGTLLRLTEEVSHPKMKWIKTQPIRKQHIEEIVAIADSVKAINPESEMLFYGTSSHLFSYLTDTKRSNIFGWKMDYTDCDRFERYIESEDDLDYVFLITGYPEKESGYDSLPIESVLSQQGYEKTHEGIKYMVYRKR